HRRPRGRRAGRERSGACAGVRRDLHRTGSRRRRAGAAQLEGAIIRAGLVSERGGRAAGRVKVLVELSRPALAAAVGALAALLLTALAGAPNVAVALAFFAAFFVASSVDLLLHGRLTP